MKINSGGAQLAHRLLVKKATPFAQMRRAVVIAIVSLCAVAGIVSAADELRADDPTAFVTSALGKLRVYHVNRTRLDWNNLEKTAIARALVARSSSELYEFVDGVVRDLGEPHSFLARPRPSTATALSATEAPRKLPEIRAYLIDEIGYIELPTFAGGGDVAVAFAHEIRTALLRLDKTPLCGWIVDLRSNEGGNMHASLLGLGRLLGEGRLGSVAGGDVPQYWHYRSNQVFVASLSEIENVAVREPFESGSSPLVQGVRRTVALPSGTSEIVQFELPVAILVGSDTMSSGEGIAVSFIGRPLVKTFGHRTRGRSSANLGFKLNGGELLVVTYGYFVDRNGNAHGPAVIPDIEISSNSALSSPRASDVAVAGATQWIHSQKRCSSEQRRK